MPEQRKFSYWNLSLWALIAILLAIPAWFGADLGYLLTLGVMLCAIAFIATVLREWSLHSVSSALTLGSCAVGILFLLAGSLRFSPIPEYIRGPVDVLLGILILVAIFYVVRLQNASDGSTEGEPRS
jgi:O-antigen/teichoic acid export membrane protein